MRELECNRALLTMALISGADVSMPAFELQDDSFKLKLKFIVKRDICFRLSVVPKFPTFTFHKVVYRRPQVVMGPLMISSLHDL